MNTRPAKYRTRDPDPSANPIHIHQSDTNPSAHHSTRGSTFSSYSTNTHHLREGSHRVIQGYIPSDRVLLILLQGRKQKPIRNPAAIQNPIAIRVQSVNARPAKYRTRTGPTTHPIVTSNTTKKCSCLNTFYIDAISVSDHTNFDKGFHFPDNPLTLSNLSHVRHALNQNTQPLCNPQSQHNPDTSARRTVRQE